MSISFPSLANWNASTETAVRGVPQGLAERSRGADRYDLHAEVPRLGPGEQPLTGAYAIAAVHDPQDLSSVQIDNGGYPRLKAFPDVGGRLRKNRTDP